MKQAVFLERDGILNEVKVERGHPVSPSEVQDFQMKPEAIRALRQLKDAGFLLIVTTNQPGLSQGTLQRRDLDLMHLLLTRKFPIDEIMVCPHLESDGCSCRKPLPGMLMEARHKHHLDLDHSFTVSDRWQDAEAAHRAGSHSILIRSPWMGTGHHDCIVESFDEAVSRILYLHQHQEEVAGYFMEVKN